MSAPPPIHPARALLPVVVPACLIGVGSSLVLLVISEIAEQLQDVLWDDLPSGLGIDGTPGAWTILILTLIGLAVGLVVWKVPGHAGPDPATESLVSAPLPIAVLPGLVLAVVLVLAGGVSLGPENPITALNIALTLALGSRFFRNVPAPLWVALGAAGTVGAMFGTPVAAALLFSEVPAGPDAPPLWDRLFGPLIAAAAGGLTTVLLAQPEMSIPVAPYRDPRVLDLLGGSLVAVAAALIGIAAVYAFPRLHRAFHQVRNPVLMLTAGGFLLGLLGALGGRITLFKGLEQMTELTAAADDYSNGRLLLIIGVKLVALLVAATCGFPGGRIFPAVFIGVAIGLLANSLVDDIPQAVCVAAAVLGIVAVVTRSGWLSLFMAAFLVPDPQIISVLVVAIVPVWLVVTGCPEMLIKPEATPEPEPVA